MITLGCDAQFVPLAKRRSLDARAGDLMAALVASQGKVQRATNNAFNALGFGRRRTRSLPADPSTTPDYAPFTSRGVDTALEIGIVQIAFTSEGRSNPTFVLSITAQARLIRIPDNLVLWSDEHMAFKSPAAEFSLWTAKDSELLKSEIESGLETLARQIIENVFLKARAGQRGPS